MKIYLFLLSILKNQFGWSTEMGVTGIADIDAAIPEFWAPGIMQDPDMESFWGQLSGKEGSGMPNIDITGPLKQKGDKITINSLAQLMGAGVTGESVLKGNEESLIIGTVTVTADIVRHAVAISKKATIQSNFDTVKNAGVALRSWMIRKRDGDLTKCILDNSSNSLYSNSKTSEGALNEAAGDIFGAQEIEMIRLALKRNGATPIRATKENGRTVPVYGIMYGEIEDYNLNQNTAFMTNVRGAWERFNGGNKNPLFSGVIGMYRNMLLYPYGSCLPLPQGTALRPETIVYATLTTTATTLSVGGASATTGVTSNYTLFFASSGSLQIADEVITYTGKTVNTFTGLTRGEADYIGGSSTTAIQHVPDALVTQRNIASVIGFGAESIFSAVGDEPKAIGSNDDYGAQIGLGIEAYYGQAVKKDARRSNSHGLVVMKVYSENPGTV